MTTLLGWTGAGWWTSGSWPQPLPVAMASDLLVWDSGRAMGARVCLMFEMTSWRPGESVHGL